jgi:hypothetical protein
MRAPLRLLAGGSMLFFAAALAACASDGAIAKHWQSGMFEEAPPSQETKIVILRVSDPSRLAASQRALEDLKRAPGVMVARRGAGEDELYALVDAIVDPETLVLWLERDGHRSWVVRIVNRSDLKD